MTAQAKVRFEDRAAAALAALEMAAARIGTEENALQVLDFAREAAVELCERQRAHDEVIAEAIALAEAGGSGRSAVRPARPARLRRDRHGLWLVQGGAR